MAERVGTPVVASAYNIGMDSTATVDELKAMTPGERDAVISRMTIAEWDEISSDGRAALLALAADADKAHAR